MLLLNSLTLFLIASLNLWTPCLINITTKQLIFFQPHNKKCLAKTTSYSESCVSVCWCGITTAHHTLSWRCTLSSCTKRSLRRITSWVVGQSALRLSCLTDTFLKRFKSSRKSKLPSTTCICWILCIGMWTAPSPKLFIIAQLSSKMHPPDPNSMLLISSRKGFSTIPSVTTLCRSIAKRLFCSSSHKTTPMIFRSTLIIILSGNPNTYFR